MSELWVLKFKTQGQDFELLFEFLEEQALSCAVIEDENKGFWCAEILFSSPPPLEELQKHLSALLNGQPWDWDIQPLPDIDWLVQNRLDFPPVHVGRYGIFRDHHALDIRNLDFPETDIALILEAATAFGSGTHASTQGCLKALSTLSLDRSFASIIDVGCGSGILAMACAKTWPHASIIASDCDPEAVRVTRLNAEHNGVGSKIRCYQAEGLDHEAFQGPFDLIIANILLEPLQTLAPSIRQTLTPQGVVILSGLLVRQKEIVETTYQEHGLVIDREIQDDPWLSLVMRPV